MLSSNDISLDGLLSTQPATQPMAIDEYFQDDDNDDGDEDGGEESLETQFQRVWLNERESPCVLPHRTELVRDMYRACRSLQRRMDSLPNNRDGPLLRTIYRMQLRRLTYLVNSYLQCRLGKVLNDPNTGIECLSTQERSFRDLFIDHVERKLHSEYVSKLLLPEHDLLKKVAFEDAGTRHVIAKAIKPIGELLIDDYEQVIVSLTAGNCIVVQWQFVEHLVRDGHMVIL